MKRIAVVLLVFLSFALVGNASEYDVNNIPEAMLKDAKSVVRKNKTVFTIANKGSANLSVEYAVTVLDENAYDRATFVQFYDKLRKIKAIKGTIYDSKGEVVKKIKIDDIGDRSMIDGAESFSDGRIKYFEPDYKYYPFTMEYSYEIEFNGLINYPDWTAYDHYDESVEQASFSVVADKYFEFKYLEQNGAPKVEIKEDKNKKIHHWEVSGLPAMEHEYFSPSEVFPTVYVAPVEFEFEGYSGFCYSWEELGAWILQLNKDRNNLSEAAKTEVVNLVKDIPDPEERIKVLYKYMQDRTRYVSIQLGIGGLQPFDALTVERLGYGDCKALTNYMKTILEVVGIPSYYVLVNAGKSARPVLKDFPSNQFNHVLLMVPVEQDTVWLECTSQQVPYNYNGTFTDDRFALAITDDGGKLVKTPSYAVNENYQIREATVIVGENGHAQVKGTTTYGGAMYDEVFGYLFMDQKEVENALLRELDIADFTLEGFTFTDHQTDIKENLSIHVNNLAKTSSNKLILPLNLMNKIENLPKKNDDRELDVFIRRSYSESDKLLYEYPVKFHLANVPEDVSIESKFGKYDVSIKEVGGKIEYVRNFEIYKGIYSPSDYNSLIDFLSAVSKADRIKVLLVSGT